MLLAGDIGGTKTLLGLFDAGAGAAAAVCVVRSFGTLDFADLPSMIAEFLAAPMRERRAHDRSARALASPAR